MLHDREEILCFQLCSTILKRACFQSCSTIVTCACVSIVLGDREESLWSSRGILAYHFYGDNAAAFSSMSWIPLWLRARAARSGHLGDDHSRHYRELGGSGTDPAAAV